MTKVLEAIAFAVLVGMFVVVGANWAGLPEQVPMHFNAAGTADRWGSRDGVWLLPVVAAGLYLMLTVISRLAAAGKIRLNVPAGVDASRPEVNEEGRRLLLIVKLLVMVTFAYISRIQISSPREGLGRTFLPVMLLVPLVVIAWSVARLRRHTRS